MDFNPDNYSKHMERWHEWRTVGSDGLQTRTKHPLDDPDITLRPRENLLAKRKKITARGTQKRTSSGSKPYYPEGFQTEQAIEEAITNIRFRYPAVIEVLETNYRLRGTVEQKARKTGYSYSDYRRKLDDAKKMLTVYFIAMARAK